VAEKIGIGSVRVVRPTKTWSAIAEGAVLAGFGRSPIVSRKSRYNIMMKIHQAFDPAVHDEEDRIFCPRYGKRATNQLVPIITRVSKAPDIRE
jgi:hypothetical protein